MPIKLPNNLPAVKTLAKENVFVMTETRAMTQDIRPLHILILNLMPTKIDTETQLTRLLGNTPLQVELELLQTSSHKTQNTSQEHMLAFYKTFPQVREKFYDGFIITGAPVELLDFEEVEYWDELCEIMEWSKTHVHSTFHICWGAQAGLYYHYGIEKKRLPEKLSGVYEHHLNYTTGMLFRGYDDLFYVPHSRNTTVAVEDVEAVSQLKIVAISDEAGIYAVKSENDRQIFIMGHSEYDGDTLLKEYLRDKKAGLNPKVPCNYFPNDDDTKEPVVKWRSCANLLYTNWLNYFVYQSTPYDVNQVSQDTRESFFQEQADVKVVKFGGSSLSDGARFKKAGEIIKAEPERRYVVVSAPGKRNSRDEKITDLLIRAYETPEARGDILKGIKERFEGIKNELGVSLNIDKEFELIEQYFADEKSISRDYIVSRGEYINGKIMAELIGADFIDAIEVISFDEDGTFNQEETHVRLSKLLKNQNIVVIPGFYGAKKDGTVVTFSRGGSDLTGSIVAEALAADLYENWTDVSGFLMADPDIVKEPRTVPVITYKELRELSYMGAAVMHEDAVFPLKKLGIPINIRNTEDPDNLGTLIVKNADYYKSDLAISGISGKMGYATVAVEKDRMSENPKYRTQLLELFAAEEIEIENILSGIDGLTIVVSQRNIDGKKGRLEEKLKTTLHPDAINITENIAMIAVVGRQLGDSPAVAVKVLGALADRKINIKIIDHGAEKISMLVGVDQKDYVNAIEAIYHGFTKL